MRDQPESLPLTSAPDARSDENSAVAGSVVPPTSPQPRHSVEKKDEETSEFKEPPRRSGRVRRAALPNTATPSASARTHKANYAEKRGARDEVLAKPFFTSLAITALLALAQEFTEPKTFGDVKGLPDKAEWIAACHEELLQFESKRVWEPFPRDMLPAGTRVLPCQYVFALKKGLDGSMRRKARLVVCGNYERNMDLNTYAATSRAQSLRAFCAKAAIHKLRIPPMTFKECICLPTWKGGGVVLLQPLSNCLERLFKLQGDVWLWWTRLLGSYREGSTCVLKRWLHSQQSGPMFVHDEYPFWRNVDSSRFCRRYSCRES